MPFGQLILGKIIKIVATRGQILRLQCTKFYFICGSAPDSLLDLRGPTSKGRKRKGREREREERKCRVPPPTFE